ncbi:MAG: FHA domain-containing protein [Myxococcota bacterium]
MTRPPPRREDNPTGQFQIPTEPPPQRDPDGFPAEFGLRNQSTRMLPRGAIEAALQLRGLPVRELFHARLDAVRTAYRGTPENGALVAAVDPARGVSAAVRVIAQPDGQPASLSIGRHERCQLCLTDPAVSLRHAIMVLRKLPTGDLRVRLIDLRTGLGLTGEDGRPLESVSVEGHLFIGLGRYVLMILLGGEDLWCSNDGGEVFDTLPPRVFFDTRERVPGMSSPRQRRLPHDEISGMKIASGTRTAARARGIMDFHSRVSIHAAPSPLKLPQSVMSGDRRGTLSIACKAGSATVPLYDAQVRDGVLLGRYDRCESADLPFELPDTVSRVHALVLSDGDGLYVVDTASTFGLRTIDDVEVPGLRLRDETEFKLGTETRVRWVPTP